MRNISYAEAYSPTKPLLINELDLLSRQGNPIYLINYYLTCFSLAILHFSYLCLLALPVSVSAYLMSNPKYRQQCLQVFRKCIELAGPAFIKWAQWAATRKDMFPEDFCNEMKKLHTKAPGHPYWQTRSIFKKTFGVPIEEIFNDFSEQPIASGSIGQVHTGKINVRGSQLTGYPTGRQVAVKVRHPNIEFQMKLDFLVMMSLVNVFSALPNCGGRRLKDSVVQFAGPLMEQVNLKVEGYNLYRFRKNFKKQSLVHFPTPLYPLVNEDVLVETFEEGVGLERYIDQSNDPKQVKYYKELASVGTNAFLKMLINDSYVHADLHPGNVLIRYHLPDTIVGRTTDLIFNVLDNLGGQKAQGEASHMKDNLIKKLPKRMLSPQVVFLDTGMVTELSDTDRRNLIGFFDAFSKFDGENVGKWIIRLQDSRDELDLKNMSTSCQDPEQFVVKCKDHFKEISTVTSWADSKFDNASDAMMNLFDIVRTHEVNLPGHICGVIVTACILESWGSKLDPSYDIMKNIEAIVSKQKYMDNIVVRNYLKYFNPQ